LEDKNDEEITLDFSKIKNIFKKKTEKDKVVEVEKEASEVKQQATEEDKEKIVDVQENLKEVEKEAEIIDAEKKLVEKNIEENREEIRKIEEKDDDAISFDFSKVKNFFSRTKKSFTQSQEDSSEDVSFDMKNTVNFIKKYYMVFLILIPFIISIYLRVMPGYLPVTDDWAKSSVYNSIKDQIKSQVSSQYPNLPQANINGLVEQQFDQFKKANKAQLAEQVKQTSAYFKSRLQKDGQTYLIAIDPYFWMRHARNILENGHPGDRLGIRITGEECETRSDDCLPWDTHMYAPLGRQVPGDMFHAYFMAYFHKSMSIFNPNQDLMSSAFIIPIILSALCIIPAFFITRRLAGNFGGFVAALIVAIHPAFMTRTVGGFADTDPYNVLFPLFIAWFFLEAFETKNWKKGIILTALAGLLIAFYAITWGGWWYIFDFLLISTIMYIGIYLFINRNNLKDTLKDKTMKNTIIVFVSFFIFSLIFTLMTADFGYFAGAFTGPNIFARLKEVGITTVWPNVFTTVAEQNPASLNSVISQIGMGSLLLFLLAIIGIALTLVKKGSKDKKDLYYVIFSVLWLIVIMAIKPQNLILFLSLISVPIVIKILLAIYSKNSKIDFKLALILIIWFTTTTYASTKGVRYLLLLVPAFSIGLGISFGFIYEYISKMISRAFDLNKILTKTVIVILLLLLMINPMNMATSTVKQEIPSMNDAWYQSLDKINQEAEPDAIINSWWDFGHWFKAIGQRGVTFDGTSQNSPMAHWIGNVLLTNDEDSAIGILRMLDCGSKYPGEILEQSLDTTTTVKILHDIVLLDKTNAKKYLLDFVDEATADKLLKYTHCDPPENYFITSSDMIGKSGVWGHFGIWDFERALMYNTLKKKEYTNNREKSVEFLKERFDLEDRKAEDIFYEIKAIKSSDQANSWIAPWPSYASGMISCRNSDNDTILCPVQSQNTQGNIFMVIDMEKRKAEINSPQGKVYPNAIVWPTEDGIDKLEFKNNTIGYSMTLIPSGDSWNYIMMLPPLEDSMFTRLFFLQGHGLTKFKRFSDERSVVGDRAIVWKVDWEGEEKNIEYFKDSEGNNTG
jgi:dolichyl-diphosphooligosaccharide--protein glycosyltransferase